MSFGARALIRLAALSNNIKQIRKVAPGAKLMAVVKANAYGHGMRRVAKNLVDVDAIAVARISEAIALRDSGIETDIVVLGGITGKKSLQAAIDRQLQLVVHCPQQLALLEAAPAAEICTWLKVDTGMHRLGFQPDDTPTTLKRLRAMRCVQDVRMMTHFSSADETENNATMRQFRQFADLLDDSIAEVSVSNSAGVFGWPSIHDELSVPGRNVWVRPGIALYGISPFANKTGTELGLKAVMQFEARLMATKAVTGGEYIGYNQAYRNSRRSVLGLISVGYGDGYSRHLKCGTPVLINGRRVPLIGHVSMDIIAVDLGPTSGDKVGDIATLWGDGLPLEEVATWANAIPYELACGVLHREASEYA